VSALSGEFAPGRYLVNKLPLIASTSQDCPIFYMRKKAQKDMKDASKNLARYFSIIIHIERFDVDW
jgi:hypothetical protein